MTKRYAKKFCLLIGVLAVLNSCAREKITPREEFSTPEKTYRLWLETAEKGDIQNNIRCVTDDSKKVVDSQIRQMDEFMSRMSANIKIFKTYTIAERRAKEDKAIVVLKGPGGEVIVVPLKKEAEGWKVDLISLFSGAG